MARGHSGGHVGYHRGGGGPGQIDILEIKAKFMANTQVFSLNNGVFFSTGSQMLVNGRLDNITSQQAQSVTKIQLTVVGQQVQAKNNCCFISTLVFGALLIIPLILMCFQWWKNTVHPKYAINSKTYEGILNLIRKCPKVTFVELNVIDTNLSKEKLQMMASGISQCPQVTNFSLKNLALDSNLQDKQYDNFQTNVECFRRLNLRTCQFVWSSRLIYLGGEAGTNLNSSFNQIEIQNIGGKNNAQMQY